MTRDEINRTLYRQLCLFGGYTLSIRERRVTERPTSKDLSNQLYDSFIGTLQLAASHLESYEFTDFIFLTFDSSAGPRFIVERHLREYVLGLDQQLAIPSNYSVKDRQANFDGERFLLHQVDRRLEPFFTQLEESSRRRDEIAVIEKALLDSCVPIADAVRSTIVDNILWFVFSFGEITLTHLGKISGDFTKNELRIDSETLDPTFRSYIELAKMKEPTGIR
jgi:hypothetical protein